MYSVADLTRVATPPVFQEMLDQWEEDEKSLRTGAVKEVAVYQDSSGRRWFIETRDISNANELVQLLAGIQGIPERATRASLLGVDDGPVLTVNENGEEVIVGATVEGEASISVGIEAVVELLNSGKVL